MKKTPVELLHEAGRLGQKNNTGFYRYEIDKKGKPKKSIDESTIDIIKPAINGSATFSDEEIIERMMMPMCYEAVRCLDENIISSPIDADMGLLMGIGFPLFRGGALKYMESVGIANMIEASKKYADLPGAGELYQAPESLIQMAQKNESFFKTGGAA